MFKDKVAVCVIHESGFDDAGWYRLEAENKLGRVQTQCTVTVNCKSVLIVYNYCVKFVDILET